MPGTSGFPEWGITMHAHSKSLMAPIMAPSSPSSESIVALSKPAPAVVRVIFSPVVLVGQVVLGAAPHIVKRLTLSVTSAFALDNVYAAWELFGFILSRSMRDRVFEPSFNDFKADFHETRKKKYRGKWAQRWLMFCFVWRLGWMVLKCIRVGLLDRGWKLSVAIAIPIGLAIKHMLDRS
jgi:hypothetical protein